MSVTSLQLRRSVDQNADYSSRFVDAEREIETLHAEIKKLKLQLLETQMLADTDPLIDVYNMRALIREIKRAQTMMERYDILSSLLYFDLNGFKHINDVYGHNFGNELLKKIGQTLKDNTRDCDMVARIGGDEFGVLLFKADEYMARAKASVLACRIAELKLPLAGEHIGVSAAWGVSVCHPQDDVKQILHRADRQMYLAK